METLKRTLAFGALALAAIGCQKKEPVIVDIDAAAFVNPFPSLVNRPIPSAAPFAGGDASSSGRALIGAEDFAELFDGDADGGSPARLAAQPGYTPYANDRFGFIVEVPNALTSKGPFGDGAGNHWELGRQIAMTASASSFDALPGHLCPSGPSVVAREETKDKCLATGKRGEMIFWERHVVRHEVDYKLVFEYREELKKKMDPVVAHVNGSWAMPGPP